MADAKAVWVIAGRDGFQPLRIWDEKWGTWRGQGDEWGGACAWFDWSSAAKHAIGRGLPVDCVLPAYLVTEGPKETLVEVIKNPEPECMWGVRHRTFNGGWSWMHKSGAWAPDPQEMDLEAARELRDCDPRLRFISPLRVTESEPTTRIELHEAAKAILDHGSD